MNNYQPLEPSSNPYEKVPRLVEVGAAVLLFPIAPFIGAAKMYYNNKQGNTVDSELHEKAQEAVIQPLNQVAKDFDSIENRKMKYKNEFWIGVCEFFGPIGVAILGIWKLFAKTPDAADKEKEAIKDIEKRLGTIDRVLPKKAHKLLDALTVQMHENWGEHFQLLPKQFSRLQLTLRAGSKKEKEEAEKDYPLLSKTFKNLYSLADALVNKNPNLDEINRLYGEIKKNLSTDVSGSEAIIQMDEGVFHDIKSLILEKRGLQKILDIDTNKVKGLNSLKELMATKDDKKVEKFFNILRNDIKRHFGRDIDQVLDDSKLEEIERNVNTKMSMEEYLKYYSNPDEVKAVKAFGNLFMLEKAIKDNAFDVVQKMDQFYNEIIDATDHSESFQYRTNDLFDHMRGKMVEEGKEFDRGFEIVTKKEKVPRQPFISNELIRIRKDLDSKTQDLKEIVREEFYTYLTEKEYLDIADETETFVNLLKEDPRQLDKYIQNLDTNDKFLKLPENLREVYRNFLKFEALRSIDNVSFVKLLDNMSQHMSNKEWIDTQNDIVDLLKQKVAEEKNIKPYVARIDKGLAVSTKKLQNIVHSQMMTYLRNHIGERLGLEDVENIEMQISFLRENPAYMSKFESIINGMKLEDDIRDMCLSLGKLESMKIITDKDDLSECLRGISLNIDKWPNQKQLDQIRKEMDDLLTSRGNIDGSIALKEARMKKEYQGVKIGEEFVQIREQLTKIRSELEKVGKKYADQNARAKDVVLDYFLEHYEPVIDKNKLSQFGYKDLLDFKDSIKRRLATIKGETDQTNRIRQFNIILEHVNGSIQEGEFKELARRSFDKIIDFDLSDLEDKDNLLIFLKDNEKDPTFFRKYSEIDGLLKQMADLEKRRQKLANRIEELSNISESDTETTSESEELESQ